MRVSCTTLGCKVNGYESQAMLEQFGRAGWEIVQADGIADVYLVNTCTVTQIAAHKSRQILHRMKRQNPNALIVACGCYVDQLQMGKDSIHSQPEEDLCDLIISNQEKEQIVRLTVLAMQEKGLLPAEAVPGNAFTEEAGFFITSSGEKTRAFLKVQDGCRQFCSYCIIPYVRGPLHSKPLQQAVQEAERLVSSGIQEIVLTGIHLSSYGRDLAEDAGLQDLILALRGISGLQRIRLGSLEVGLITPSFVESVKDVRKLCPHFHLSLQSGCAKTLKAMNRRYTPASYMEAVALLRDAFPDAAITTDVITGFPGETEEDFEESLSFVRQIGFSALHVFPYSPREGTAAAARSDQVEKKVRTERAARMMQEGQTLSVSYAEGFIGRTMEVLIERQDSEGYWEGYTANYLRVRMKAPAETNFSNRIVTVAIHSITTLEHEVFLLGDMQ